MKTCTFFGHKNAPQDLKTAIDYRNRWMVERSDCVITYVNRSWGGAAKYKKFAQNRGKTVYELNELKKVNE